MTIAGIPEEHGKRIKPDSCRKFGEVPPRVLPKLSIVYNLFSASLTCTRIERGKTITYKLSQKGNLVSEHPQPHSNLGLGLGQFIGGLSNCPLTRSEGKRPLRGAGASLPRPVRRPPSSLCLRWRSPRSEGTGRPRRSRDSRATLVDLWHRNRRCNAANNLLERRGNTLPAVGEGEEAAWQIITFGASC